jgi:DNA-binding MarR family transcriptional regulator
MVAPDFQSDLAEIADSCLARKVRQASRVICSAYDEALRPFGVKVSQFNLLVAVGVMGECTPTDLGLALCLEKSTVSRNVERMVAQGWLSAAQGEPRSVLYRLSRKGKLLVQRLAPEWRAAESKARAMLGEEATAALDRLGDSVIPKPAP